MKIWLALIFSLLSAAQCAEPVPSVPPGLSAGDWNGIRAEYERHRHSAVATLDGQVLRNPGQQWTTHCDGRGFLVTPDAGTWTWGLELQSYGFAGAEGTPLLRPLVTANGACVIYEHDGNVEEWFVNDERGLEHGFTLRERPAQSDQSDSSDKSDLCFTLAVRGSLAAAAHPDGQSVQFQNENGTAMLTYAGLKVWDAAGRTLPARMESADGTLRLLVDETGAHYPLTIDPVAQQAYLKASNTGAGSLFGYAVAVSGDTAVVSGMRDSSTVVRSGTVYVFVRTGTTWTQQAMLKASNAGDFDHFGWSVGISGNTIVVGAMAEDSIATGVGGNGADNSALDSGAAYVFIRSGTTWTQQAYLKAANTDAGDSFGTSVAISGDTVVVGAPSEASIDTGPESNDGDDSAPDAGAAYVFVRTGIAWTQQSYLKASNTEAGDFFGVSVAVEGNTIAVGASSEDGSSRGVNGNADINGAVDAGAVFVFTREETRWFQEAYVKASNPDAGDQFGFRVALSGETLVAGARGESSSSERDENDNGTLSAGAAYVFLRSGTVWSQEAYLKATHPGVEDQFGNAVAVSGDTIAIGAPGEASSATGIGGNEADNSAPYAGAVYVFTRRGTRWSREAYVKAANTGAEDYFGWSVALSGDTAVAGAFFEDSSATGVNSAQNDDGALSSGAASVFLRTAGTWAQQAYLKAPNSANNDQFGWSVAVSGDLVVVGAPQESSNATGVNGNQADNSFNQAGAAYIFARSGGVWTQEAYLKASNPEALDRFGHAVAAGNDYVVVGAPEEDSGGFGINHPTGQSNNSVPSAGAAYIFVRSGGVWSQHVYVKAAAFNPGNLDRFGWSIAASGETVVIGSPDQDTGFTAGAGAAYVFTRSGGVWTQQWFLKATHPDGDDRFGTSVAVDGNTIVVGAPREDSSATGVNGNELDINAGLSGAAYVFVRNAGVWSQQAFLKASNTGAGDSFGWSVGAAGDTVVVGANLEDSNGIGGQLDNSFGGSGAAYVFVRNGTVWSQEAWLKASNTAASEGFGYSVAASGDTVVAGANVAGNSGTAYVFNRSGGLWSQQAIVKASNAGPGDDFGWALALSGSTLVVGAYREDSNARGVNGNQADNSAPESGAAYVFDLAAPTCVETWRQTWFGNPDGNGDEADLADKDRDGQVNLIEFATGQNPLVSTPRPFALTKNGSTLEFTWPRYKCPAGEASVTVEWSDTLSTWSTTGVTSSVLSDLGTVEQMKSTVPAGTAGKRYVRLRITVP